ncbi:MAG: TIGR04282 family arsenosugar biosynthesis glycosyltransferase [Beijerinckiaceae bacterium]|nr:TIGR04282 family arsenosugar biosynthesis glycosyltransferase [Beijerinckiaceae bacterium]
MTRAITIAIFTRAPVPGAAKTRLIPALGAQGAAHFHSVLTRHAVAQALASNLGPVELWCAPDVAHPFFAACAREFGVALRAQPQGDLGVKMLGAFEAAPGPLLLMGSDCPAITPADLTACAHVLENGANVVFLPAEDGGYGLVGAARPIPPIFKGVDWGGPAVMSQTRDKLTALGLTWREPRVVWDVDHPEDYERVMREGLLHEPARERLPNSGAPD